MPLVYFSPHSEDIWTLADSYQGVAIFGENGSGKTSGSGATLARNYLKAGFGGLVLCAKTDEAGQWRKYLKETGREQDGRFFSVDNEFRFNWLNYEAKTSGRDFAENLVTLLIDIASINSRSSNDAKEPFWLMQKKKLIRNAIVLLIMSGEPIRLHTLYRMIIDAPGSPEEVKSSEWQKESLLYGLLIQAERKCGQSFELGYVSQYWLSERPHLPSKTRETIDADFTGMFDPLIRQKMGELFGTISNLTPNDILAGKVVVIDIPVAEYREVGQYAALIWAQLFQRAVDRREYVAPGVRPVFLWEDEAHHFSIEQDALFQTTARSKGISVVRLTQNVPNFLDAYGRDGKHKVDTLLGNHATKIFHRNGDPATNEWAARTIAKEISYKHQLSSSGSIQSSQGFNASASVSELIEDSCQTFEFIDLKNGGKKNDHVVEGILFQSGRKWLRDKRWVVRRFRQK